MSLKKINIAVIGATGFVGLDLINLLTKHPKVKILNLCAQKNQGKSIKLFDKRIKKNLPKISKVENIEWNKLDVIFLSLPNGEAQKFIKRNILHKKITFIDLSGDFRLISPSKYKYWYGRKHQAKNLIRKSKEPKVVKTSEKSSLPADYQHAQDQLSRYLGSKIQLKRDAKTGKGSITINFANDSDLNRLIELIEE